MSEQQPPQLTIDDKIYDVSKLSPETQGHYYALADTRARLHKAQLDVHIYANAQESLSLALREGVMSESEEEDIEVVEAEEA